MASSSNAEASSAFTRHSYNTRVRKREEEVRAIVLEEDDADDGDVFLSPKKRKRTKKPKPTPSMNVTASDRNNEAIYSRILLEATVRAFMTPFCAVTSYPNVCSVVQVCHVVSRRLSWAAVPWMRALEYVLGFRFANTLNLDSRFNNILLKSEYHCFFDHLGFILLPLHELLKRIQAFVEKNVSLPLDRRKYFLDALKMPKNGWKYILLPLQLGSYHSIFVQATKKIEGEWTVTGKGRSHKYPFHTLPIIRSHVHPCYVMVNAWEQLGKIKSKSHLKASWTLDQQRSAKLCFTIVDSWMAQEIPTDFRQESTASIPSQLVVDEDRSTPPPPSNGRTIDIADVHTLPEVVTPTKAPSKDKGKARSTD